MQAYKTHQYNNGGPYKAKIWRNKKGVACQVVSVDLAHAYSERYKSVALGTSYILLAFCASVWLYCTA